MVHTNCEGAVQIRILDDVLKKLAVKYNKGKTKDKQIVSRGLARSGPASYERCGVHMVIAFYEILL